jgi:prepilin-type N-terminal cleavage/methylation domain-containing protein
MHDAGFTLAELTIVIVVVSIASLVFAALFVEAVRAFQFVDAEDNLLQETRYAADRITREMMQIGRGSGIREASPEALSFVDADSIPVRIAWDGTKGSDLLYTRGGSSRALASQVDSLAFGYFGRNGNRLHAGTAVPTTGIRRVTVYLRLARDGHAVACAGGAFLRGDAR